MGVPLGPVSFSLKKTIKISNISLCCKIVITIIGPEQSWQVDATGYNGSSIP